MSSVLTPVLNFSEISKNDFPKVGLKAANIGELVKSKIPVPTGFVTTSESYFYFLDMARIREKIVDILTSLDVENNKELEEASNLIQDMIIKSTVPPVIENAILKSYSRLSGFVGTYVAVRSSISYDDLASDSFAGMSATFLNIKGGKDVVLAVKACWASLFEPNSIYYRAIKGLSHMKAGMPVIVQKMVQSEVSGVMFTINPINKDNSRVIIESVLGLGDIIEADSLTPDHYEVDKAGMKIDVKRVSKQGQMIIRSTKHKETEEQIKKVAVAEKWQNAQKVEDQKITELSSIGKVIEQHFGEPQDIEWVMENGKVYILQTRPLPSLDTNAHLNQLEKEVHKVLDIETPAQEIKEEIEQPQKEAPVIRSSAHETPVVDEQQSQIILSGSPASEGLTKGHVRIVRTNDDFVKLNAGDILVIDRIIPDYILWMRKTAGIITNEGGMTSHAAILSREFKIPCIVGTENATDILTDGDYIEINGNNGRVYKIEETPITPITQIHEQTKAPEEINPEPEQILQETPAAQVEQITEAAVEENLPENVSDFMSKPEPMTGPQVTFEREYTPQNLPASEEKKEEMPKDVIYHKNIKTATKIMLNLSDKQVGEAAAEKDSDGIGYINGTTILNNVIKKHPEAFIEEEAVEKYVAELASVLESLCKDFNPRTVIYRPSNLIPSQLGFDSNRYEENEENPILGYNGALKYIQNPSLFNLEIEAIKTVRNKFGYKNLSLMLPMIRDTKDLREIKKIITSNDLKRSSTFKIYLPIESPSTILLINELMEIGIDGIFIFAKTLSGLLNAVDLDNPKYKGFNIFNEAFMLSTEVVIKTAHKNKIPTGVILEDKEFDENALKEIIEWGAINISVDPFYLEKTKVVVSNIEKTLILSRRK